MSKLVYISGPYSASTKLSVEANINNAREVALWCVEHRIFYFCPHLNSGYFEQWAPDVPPDFYYDMDLRIAQACDAIFLLKGYHHSKGAQREYMYFKLKGKSIFTYKDGLDKLLSWHRGEDE